MSGKALQETLAPTRAGEYRSPDAPLIDQLYREDVVVSILRWARGDEEDDVRNVMAVPREKLDGPYLESWCRRPGTMALLDEIRRSLPLSEP